jgi:hypothetical protein
MKIAAAMLTGAVLAALSSTPAAQAQGVPPGSYQQSCTDAHIERGALVATCRGERGRVQRSALADVGRCTGDIGNNNGVLQCNYANGPARASVLPTPGYGRQEPGFAGPREPAPGNREGYGAPRYGEPAPGYGPREGYGDRRYGEERYGGEGRERCFEFRREAERLRDRLGATYDPNDRARIEGRLREVHEQEERCR